MPRTILSRFTSAALVAVAAAPAFVMTACATADSGVANPNAGLLDPASDTPGLSVGDHAPMGELLDAESNEIRVADLYSDQPAVLIFYRGGWCPYCTRDLREWEGALPEFENAGARVVAISLETPEHAYDTTTKNELSYDVLVDPTGNVVKGFRLGFQLDETTTTRYKGYGIDLAAHNANASWELPAPAVYVVDTSGVIRYANADWDYTERVGHEDALEAVRGLN